MYKSSGTLIFKGKKYRGELISEEKVTRFACKKLPLELPYAEMEVLKNVRNGGMSSTITVKMKDGNEYVFIIVQGRLAFVQTKIIQTLILCHPYKPRFFVLRIFKFIFTCKIFSKYIL